MISMFDPSSDIVRRPYMLATIGAERVNSRDYSSPFEAQLRVFNTRFLNTLVISNLENEYRATFTY